MAVVDPHQTLATLLGVPADLLSRAFHNVNLLISLELPLPQRVPLIQGLFAHAQQPVPSAERVEGLIANGPLANGLGELRVLDDLGDEELRAIALSLGHADLGMTMGALLEDITGVAALGSVDLPSLAELRALTAAAEAAREAAAAAWAQDAAAAAALDPVTLPWDAIFCAYDVQARRHRLTLLRTGGSIEGAEVEADAEWMDADPAAEWLYGDALSAPLSAAAMGHLLDYARTFRTPPVPDLASLVEQLQAEFGPFRQLYFLEVEHHLPAPSAVVLDFWLKEAGERGQEQRLAREVRVEPVGLGLEGAETVLQARWNSPARLLVQGTERPYRPFLLTMDSTAALPMAGGWQARTGWSLGLRPLLAEGPMLPVSVELDLQGRVALQGQGHLQEHLSATSGLFAAVYDDAGRCLRCLGAEEQAPPGGIDWDAGASSGVGTLTVHARGGDDRDLSTAGVQVAAEHRPSPGIPPRIGEEALAGTAPMVPLQGSAVVLSGAVVVEQTARMEDGLRTAQSTAQVRGEARLETPLTAAIAGHHLQITLSSDAGEGRTRSLPIDAVEGLEVRRMVREYPWGGTIRVEGVPRWQLRWRSRVEQATASWDDHVEMVSGGAGAWGAATETLREGVVAHHAVMVERMTGSYWLEPLEGEDGAEE